MMTPGSVNRMIGKSNSYQIWERTTSHVHIYMSRTTSKPKEGVMIFMFVKSGCGFTLGNGFSGKSLAILRNCVDPLGWLDGSPGRLEDSLGKLEGSLGKLENSLERARRAQIRTHSEQGGARRYLGTVAQALGSRERVPA